MKKLLLSLALMLMTTTGMAMESLTSAQQLQEKVFGEQLKLTIVVYTLAQDARSKPYLDLITSYEAKNTNSNMVFFLAPLENEELDMVATALRIQRLPTTIVSMGGRVVQVFMGIPTMEQLDQILKESAEKAKQAPETTEETKSKTKTKVTKKVFKKFN